MRSPTWSEPVPTTPAEVFDRLLQLNGCAPQAPELRVAVNTVLGPAWCIPDEVQAKCAQPTPDYTPSAFARRMIAAGAFWGCVCGESFYQKAHVFTCKKCRQGYAPEGVERVAIDYRTGERHSKPRLQWGG